MDNAKIGSLSAGDPRAFFANLMARKQQSFRKEPNKKIKGPPESG
jgi:hypothetical protein